MNAAANAIIVQKTPAGLWDITINWACPTRDLGDDTIITSEWDVSGNDEVLTLSDESIAVDGKSTTAWLNEGTLNNFYLVTNTITTSGGRVLTGTFIVQIVPYVFLTQPRVI